MKPCPFCGSLDCPEISHISEAVDRITLELLELDQWAVVCAFTRGGCGASSGFKSSQREAMDAWNRRYYELL